MIKVPRSQSTAIKNVIYPEGKKMASGHHKKNIEALKKKQKDNKIKKEEQETYVKRNFKLIIF